MEFKFIFFIIKLLCKLEIGKFKEYENIKYRICFCIKYKYKIKYKYFKDG